MCRVILCSILPKTSFYLKHTSCKTKKEGYIQREFVLSCHFLSANCLINHKQATTEQTQKQKLRENDETYYVKADFEMF